MADAAYTPRRTTWDGKWNGNGLGTSMEIDPALKYQMEPIVRGTTGKLILGHWIYGLVGSIKINIPDISPTQLSNLSIWATDSGAMHPTSVINAYSVAQPLILHPHDMGDTTQDLVFPKAVPSNPVNMKRDGMKDDIWVVEFMIYPDLAKLFASPSVIVMGYVGSTEPTS